MAFSDMTLKVEGERSPIGSESKTCGVKVKLASIACAKQVSSCCI
jgi:hypothetical protein